MNDSLPVRLHGGFAPVTCATFQLEAFWKAYIFVTINGCHNVLLSALAALAHYIGLLSCEVRGNRDEKLRRCLPAQAWAALEHEGLLGQPRRDNRRLRFSSCCDLINAQTTVVRTKTFIFVKRENLPGAPEQNLLRQLRDTKSCVLNKAHN